MKPLSNCKYALHEYLIQNSGVYAKGRAAKVVNFPVRHALVGIANELCEVVR